MEKEIRISGFYDPCSSMVLEKCRKMMNTDLVQITVHGNPVLDKDDTISLRVTEGDLIAALEKLKKRRKKLKMSGHLSQ